MKQDPASAKPHFSREGNLKSCVQSVVRSIPSGRVMTYGQLAAVCHQPRSARVVGGIAHYGNPSLPWHRVVNKNGGLATGYPGGRRAHAKHLRSEGVDVSSDFYIRLSDYLWNPRICSDDQAENK